MAARAPAWVPRSFFDHPDEFGLVDGAKHRLPVDLAEAGQLIASVAQHRAALVIRSHRHGGLKVRELASRLGSSEDYLSGQLTGRYPAGLDDIARWAVAVGDSSVLPVFDDLNDLLPPQ